MIKDSRNILQISYDDQTRHIFDTNFILLQTYINCTFDSGDDADLFFRPVSPTRM